MPRLSVVIPTLNESKSKLFAQVLATYRNIDEVEVLIADGGSSDETLELAALAGAKVIDSHPKSRAERINAAVALAKASMVLINHPRSVLSPEGVRYLLQENDSLTWGGFTHSFDINHPFLRFTSWYSNEVRAKLRGIVYLDHCKFARKDLLDKVGSIPPVEIFEDTLLSKMLYQAAGKPSILPFVSKTSAIRFTENGMLKQGLLNQWMKISFYFGRDHRRMNRVYEGKIKLNSED